MKDKIKREEFKQMFLTGEWSMKNYTLENYIDELFDHIESIEAENQELKEKLNESYVKYTKETSRLEQRNGNLEAKLKAIESNKVAEFSTAPYDENKTINDARYLLFAGHGNTRIVYGTYKPNLENGEIYTVTISKDK